ncbi:hypothetical protein [Cognatilysobacter bugurensis]|uniref:Uncharacterized protein n=1 Tax=Cognatilysobacter bugurensis TaxID=543356 RepID=A0A918W6V9_9GAMM|nr:hypothetical protein [Lysobacter bugurensis]GHA79498.1 hypothetical protein GCM10007067_16270 [Lysobacter bugurensis]
MHLVQLLLPLYDNSGASFERTRFDEVRAELAGEFGGVTAYVRAPAVGLWEDDDGECERDDVMLFEVLVESLDREWWARYRKTLERRFAQDSVLVRALPAEQL